jgi:hypothetical protein
VAPGPVVEHFNVIEDIGPGQIPGFIDAFSDPLFFSELKNDSATALSQQLPRLLMLGARLLARQKRCQSSLPYWLPWSECTMTSPSGFRRQTASSAASSASSRERVGFIDQPTTLRAKRSITTARYSQPCQVRIVISVTQT